MIFFKRPLAIVVGALLWVCRKVFPPLLLLTLTLGNLLYTADVYAGSYSAFGSRVYHRHDGKPILEVDTFQSNVTGSFTLQISNGGLEDDEYNLVSASVIYLNGVEILSPNELNQNVSYLEKTVTLESVNEISVEVRGKPGGALILNIIGADNMPPTISTLVAPVANAEGWHNGDVTVTFTCNDFESGVDTCSSPTTVSTEGTGQTVTGIATDIAGNSASTNVMLNIDKTPPVLAVSGPVSGITVTESPIYITGQMTDALSGVRSNSINGAMALTDANGQFNHPVSLVEGANTISIEVVDAAGNKAMQTLQVSYQPNQPPVAHDQSVTTGEDTVTAIILNATDADGDVLAYQVMTQPQQGVLTGTAPNLIYTPNADYHGTDGFTFRVNDGLSDSLEAVVEITIASINDAPQASNLLLTVTENTPIEVILAGTDKDGDPLTYQVITQPSNGYLFGQAPNLVYLSDSFYSGQDEITYIVDDGLEQSEVGVIDITVNDSGIQNHAPRFLSTPETSLLLRANAGLPELLDLSVWTEVHQFSADSLTKGDGVWEIAADGSSVLQKVNRGATALISDFDTDRTRLEGQWIVETSSDDDFMGFVFGFQNPYQFYVFSWKQNSQGTALRGMEVKVYNLNPDGSEGKPQLWNSNPENGLVLYRNDMPWRDFTLYDFSLEIGDGVFTITVHEGSQLLDAFTVADGTFLNGKFGFYNQSQDKVRYSGFTKQTLAGFGYNYPVDVIDPDGDNVTLTLAKGPEGMSLDAENLLTWVADAEDIGSHQITLAAEDPLGLKTEQQFDLLVLDEAPAITSTPLEQAIANTSYAYNVYAIDPTPGDQLQFTLASSPLGMSIGADTGLIEWLPTALDQGIHTVIVKVTDIVGNTDEQAYVLTVDIAEPNIAPVFTSSPPTLTEAGSPYSYTPTAFDADGDSVQFSLVQVPYGMQMFNGTQITWRPVSDQTGRHRVILEVVDARGGVAYQDFEIEVAILGNRTPVITSAPINYTGTNLPYRYSVIAFDPDGDEISYELSQAPASMSISASGLISWQPDDSAIDTHTIVVRVTDSIGLASEQAYFLTVVDSSVSNLPPTITSQPAASALLDQTYTYQIVASDSDGDPLTYILKTAPEDMTISTAGFVSWTPGATGMQTVKLDVLDDNGGRTSQSFVVTVTDGTVNQFPTITSSPGFTGAVDYFYQYQVTATDPDNDDLIYGIQNAPAGMEIDNSGLISWTPTIEQIGDHEIVVWVSDGQYVGSQTYTLIILDVLPPLEMTVTITPKVAIAGENVEIEVMTSGGIGVRQVGVTVNGEDQAIANGIASFVPQLKGKYDVVVTVASDYQTIIEAFFSTVGDANDITPPEVIIHSPTLNESITAITDVVVTVDDENLAEYKLVMIPTDKPLVLDGATILATGSSNVSQAQISQFDPTLLSNGIYHLILIAEDLNGQTTTESLTVIVEGNLKVGNFSVTIEDLNIPLAGIPIQVSRTYDSRQKMDQLAFGYGWNIDYQNIKLHESRQPTEGWSQQASDSIFYINGSNIVLPSTCTYSLSERIVTVTLPNGDVEKFVAHARPISGGDVSVSDPDCTLVAGRYVSLWFEPMYGTHSELESLDGTSLYLSNVNGGNLALDIIETQPFDVKSYQLTTKAGYIYKLDQYFGVETITDPNGNTITYSDTGIVHSSGKSVSFNRNAGGQITSITDPVGNQIVYSYDVQGNLASVTDRSLATSTYSYNAEHGLLDIVDPLGRNLVKNIYDIDGRLVAQEDNAGNRTDYNHNIDGGFSIVTNRLGYATQYQYDDNGNITTEIDALGNISQYTFDSNDNQLSKTDALGNSTTATYNAEDDQLTQTEELGNTVAFTYNGRGQELTITDATGNVFTNDYDPVGNLLSITDPQNNVASNTINLQGLPATLTDALGNITSFTYDNDGNKLTEADALGNVTTFTYDANNNVLTETVQRTVDGVLTDETTSFEYDAMDRLVRTTDALGNVTDVVYDEVGNKVQDIDALGRITAYTYDVYGRITRTDYPDGTTTSKAYDVEGNLVSETDANGNTTSFTYDALNRLTQTTFADGSSTQTGYDAVGQATSETDESGNVTTYQYDAAGRRTQATDALGNITTFAYDENGNQVSQTDALNRTTVFVYDSLDRKIQTTFFDNSTLQQGYDPLARKTSDTDQAGIVTSFGYDALGRLSSVTDALGNITSYTYDETGNKLTQTDAEGRTTSWSYDALGRVLTRTLPMGQVETMSYDAVGNMVSKTDFNDDLTSYGYDSNDRLTLTTYNDGTTESYSYDAAGNRLTATSDQGTWVYSYDNRQRLATETKPGGEILAYNYDANGSKTELKVTYVNGDIRIETYSYDTLNRLLTVTDNDGNITTYGYDTVGNRTSVSYQNGSSQTYSYDSLNRLTGLSHFDGSGALINQYDYTLHSTGRRTEIAESTGRTSTYSYDDIYRLTDETIVDPANGDHGAEYQYDNVGNRTQSIINGVTTGYSYDDNDRLSQQGGETFTYDDMGNTLTKTIDSDITSYSYNAKQELTTADITEASVNTTSSYQYNIDGIRTSKTEDGISTNFLVDSNQSYAQVIAEIDDLNTINVEYIYGDDLIGQDRQASGYSYYLYDGLGSTRYLTDSLGTVTDSYDYDAFGSTLNQTGTTDNDYLFAGEQFDGALDNYYLRARYYDPGIGRFTQMDEWRGINSDPRTLHKYLYTANDPVNMVDPSGHFFSLGSVSATNNIQGILATTATVNFSRAIGQVAVGLVGAGLGYGLSEDLKDFIAANAPAMNEILEEKRTFARDTVEEKARGRKVLYHYSDRGSVLSIAASGVGLSSPGFGRGRPPGFYASSITPWSIQHTQEDLSAIFYGGNRDRDVSWFVAIDGQSFLKHPGNSNEFFRPSNTGYTDLDVISVGPNLMLPK